MDVKGGIRGQKDQAGIGTQTSSAMDVARGHVNEIAMMRNERFVIFHLGLQ